MKTLKIITLIITTILLSGCYSTRKITYQMDIATQELKSQINLSKKQLINNQVLIFKNNEFMFLILPNKIFFNPNSANLTARAYKILDLVLELTAHYDKSVISVKGFTKNNYSDAISKAIAAERAHKIVQYLWNSGIDASFMYATGNIAPVIKNKKAIYTNCVVISFRKESGLES